MPNTDPVKHRLQNRKDQATYRLNHPTANREYRKKIREELLFLREYFNSNQKE